MKKLSVQILALSFSLLLASALNAQTVDAGRGELPLKVPASYTADDPVPLIVLLHGYTSSGANQDSYMQFSALADAYGFLFVAPDGLQENSDDRNRYWNASDACCNFFGGLDDDGAYLMRIIDQVKERYSVDPDRVYLIGHSNGGFMSYHMAYRYPDTIAAIASLAGAEASQARPSPEGPVHVLQIHGTNDGTIAYEGGDIQGNIYPGAVETVERWAEYNGCAVEGREIALLDLDNSLPGLDTRVTRYDNSCQVGGSSELWTIDDGSHVPPVSDSFNENVVEWLFAHPKVGGGSSMTSD